MEEASKFFEVLEIEGITEIILGTADFVSRPIILLAQDDLVAYIDDKKPSRVVMNFKHVGHISSEFLNLMLRIHDHVVGQGGQVKLSHLNETVRTPFQITHWAGRLFDIYENTPQAIDAF
jgi:anti-anti-sigma regulatory factor